MRKIYIATSWKMKNIAMMLKERLVKEEHQVDLFCDLKGDRKFVFNWDDLFNSEEEKNKSDIFDVIYKSTVINAFEEDKKWLDWCDTCILLVPSGKSAHLEAGYVKGRGKNLYIFGEFYKGDFDVMYRFADAIFRIEDIDKLINILQTELKGENNDTE